MTGTRSGAWPVVAAAAIAVAAVVALWPGVATWDTLTQYAQATSGAYDDWHPPAMARLWALLLAAGLRGTGPLLAVQIGLWWAGLGLLAGGLARAGRPGAAVAALALGALPPVAGWLVAVLKDCQLVAALTAATGIVAWRRLAGRRLGPAAGVAVAALLAYATLARANAAFGTVPLAFGWAGWGGRRRWWSRAALVGGATAAVLAVQGPVDHRLLGAARSDVERTPPLYDMAGIAHHARLATLPHLAPADWAAAERRGCYTPFYWDPFADPARCGAIGTALALDRDGDWPPILTDWAAMVARHPLAYAAHRVAHLNSTLRIAAPADERIATAPMRTAPNAAGIGLPPRAVARRLVLAADRLDRTPLGVPAVWLVAAIGLWWLLAGTPRGRARDLALAAAASSCLQTASFAVVSVASDLRYHLWPIAACAMAAVLTAASDRVPPRRAGIVLAATAAAAALSVLLRR